VVRHRERDGQAVITSARFSRTLDTNARRTRYLWTMAIRVVCFLGGTVTPMPWNLLLFVAAAVLPALAVLLANAIDLRSQPPATPSQAEADHPELANPETVPGQVVDSDS